MFETFWSLLNIILLIMVLAGAIKVGKLIKEKWGSRYTVLFAFIALILVGKSSKNDNYKDVDFRAAAALRPGLPEHTIALMKQTPTGKYTLDIRYSQDTLTGAYVPLGAGASRTGIIFSNNWKPGLVVVNTSDDNRYWHYTVTGIKEWYFLSALIYTENLNFNGKVLIKPAGK